MQYAYLSGGREAHSTLCPNSTCCFYFFLFDILPSCLFFVCTTYLLTIPVVATLKKISRNCLALFENMERWVNRVALVTGASAGIGAAICQILCQNGMKVVGCARRVEKIEELQKECKSLFPYKVIFSKKTLIFSFIIISVCPDRSAEHSDTPERRAEQTLIIYCVEFLKMMTEHYFCF